MGEKCALPDVFLVNHFVSDLTPAYDHFRTSFFQTRSLINVQEDKEIGVRSATAVTFEEVVYAADREEQEQKARTDEVKTALVASSGTNPTARYGVNPANPNQVLKPVNKCSHCSRIGHLSEGCWNLHPELKKRAAEERKERAAKRQKKGGKPADVKAEEPSALVAFNGKTLDLGEFGFMAHTEFPLADACVIDSGCSQHTSNRED